MNNTQFRNLLLAESVSKTPHSKDGIINSKDAPATPLLGSRARSSIPMTPRSVVGHSSSNEFARQVAEHKGATLAQGPASTKRFRSSAAPKGTKYAAGYQDRAALLRQQEGEDTNGKGGQGHNDKEERIKALEDMVKLQQIDQATFQNLRDEIGVGGDLKSTHLVKGLDWRLLEKVKRGEDITTTEEVTAADKESTKQDIDEALEGVLGKEVQAAQREKTVKKGEMAPPSSLTVSEDKMSRDEILKRLKASRMVIAKELSDAKSKVPSLGSKFRKFGSGNDSEKKKFVETVKGRKREVLIITNPDGTTKRKARWIDEEDSKTQAHLATAVGAALGMEIPAEVAAKQKAMLEKQKLEEEEDDDIFAGVGADYDPLGSISDDSDDEWHADSNADSNAEMMAQAATALGEKGTQTVDIKSKPHNYFPPAATDEATTNTKTGLVADPNILSALKRAAAIRKAQEDAGAAEDEPSTGATSYSKDFLDRLRKREREDAGDLDMGFGESRFGDEEDEEGPIWNDEEDGKKTEQRRRPKKRKGNKNEMSDVMTVLDRGKK